MLSGGGFRSSLRGDKLFRPAPVGVFEAELTPGLLMGNGITCLLRGETKFGYALCR